jgi:hypothetical protein
VRELLTRAGVPAGDALRGPALATAVVVTGAGGYRVVFAIAECDPAFTDRVAILADRKDGAPLPPNAAPFRLVITGEKRPARWVGQVVAIELMSRTAVYRELQGRPHCKKRIFLVSAPDLRRTRTFSRNHQKMVPLVEFGHREIFTITD